MHLSFIHLGNYGYFNPAAKTQYAIGSPRGAKSRTGAVYIVEYDGTENFRHLQKLIPSGMIIISLKRDILLDPVLLLRQCQS